MSDNTGNEEFGPLTAAEEADPRMYPENCYFKFLNRLKPK